MTMTIRKAVGPKARKRRVLLVDDHAILREGFAEIINSKPDLQVCGEASTAGRAIDSVNRLKPDLVVVDISLQGGSGLELIKSLKVMHPRLPMLVLSMHEESLYAERALRAGALGYVMKREESKIILEAIRTALKGELFVNQSVRDQMLQEFVGGKKQSWGRMGHLTDRELEILELIGQGRTTVQIAKQLHISTSTVETHRVHLKGKLHVQNVSELMRVAVEWASQH
jgi:DNA-binding NarL/FixJ family response regulator